MAGGDRGEPGSLNGGFDDADPAPTDRIRARGRASTGPPVCQPSLGREPGGGTESPWHEAGIEWEEAGRASATEQTGHWTGALRVRGALLPPDARGVQAGASTANRVRRHTSVAALRDCMVRRPRWLGAGQRPHRRADRKGDDASPGGADLRATRLFHHLARWQAWDRGAGDRIR